MFTLYVAGIDTSRLSLRFAILHMVANPEIQKKVQEEVDRVVGTVNVFFLFHFCLTFPICQNPKAIKQ